MEKDLNIIGVIPARYESRRLPHKLLRIIHGKTLLQWTWENAKAARLLDRLVIACDHPDIQKAARDFGAEVVMTSPEHPSGSDRIAEAVRDIEVEGVINIQADEPLMHPSIIDSLALEILSSSKIIMATVRKKIDIKEDIKNPNVVKVICDKSDFAIYFSRLPLPYYRQKYTSQLYYKHLGIYAYTKDFLYTFKNLPSSYLEKAEKLEQLRVLEAGYKIKVIETQFDSYGVDVEADLDKVKEIIAQKIFFRGS
ncbi:MAG: 3-deoxy-manno-octulosonate cytidylyltransferase [Candidatus Omnitrophica bacterium]|nr:3-deoxy-manno-octulosonate cytidylyltransferase [Candidatus Omnitrophota bacterium]MBD3269565.1 3-deoxy-manno-octulosonate cytidylyltransferase [Candidatus Omnitrophota bacterium]